MVQTWRWLGIDLNMEPTVGGFARFTCRQLRTILTFYVVLFILRPFKIDLQFVSQYVGLEFRYPNIEGARNEKARNSKLVLSGVVCIYGVMLVH